MKVLKAALFIILIVFCITGCRGKEVLTSDIAPENSESVKSVVSDESSSELESSSEQPVTENQGSAQTSIAKTPVNLTVKENNNTTEVPSDPVTLEPEDNTISEPAVPEYDDWFLVRCVKYNYNYTILDSIVNGTIGYDDFERLQLEIEINANNDGGSVKGGVFSPEDPSVIGDTAAIQKAREYIKTIYNYDIPADLAPDSIVRRDYSNISIQSILKEKYYNISFVIPVSKEQSYYYRADICAASGNCIGGYFQFRDDTAIEECFRTPSAELVEAKRRSAEAFVQENNFFPNASIAYIFSVPFVGVTHNVKTIVYLDNGYSIKVYESHEEGKILYFSIFPTHGFHS